MSIHVYYIRKPMSLDKSDIRLYDNVPQLYKGALPVYMADLVVHKTSIRKYNVIKDAKLRSQKHKTFKSVFEFRNYAKAGKYTNVILVKHSVFADILHSLKIKMFGQQHFLKKIKKEYFNEKR